VTVLVVGPAAAGATTLLGALRERLPDVTFAEADDWASSDAPAAVVFVVSAVAPVSESDRALLDSVARDTDLVVGVVAKIDAHRAWRDVLGDNRRLLADHAIRYASMPWVGAAAAPDLGQPRLDELVGLLRERLADPDALRRNRLRSRETRLQALIADTGSDRGARMGALRAHRERLTRELRAARAEHPLALRSRFQQARVRLGYLARNRCTSLRAELAEDAARLGRRRLAEFEAHARTRVGEVLDELEADITAHLDDVAADLSLPAPPRPAPAGPPDVPAPPRSRRLETQLTLILGAGFGLGVALALTRLLSGPAVGVALGLLSTGWVVGIRGLLHARAVLDRWVGDVAAVLRSAAEERVATRVLAAETALTAEAAARVRAESAAAAAKIARIDAELQEHVGYLARTAAVRDARLPTLRRALDQVRAELGEPVSRNPAGRRAATGF